LRGAPVYRLWGLSTDTAPLSNYTLGIDTPEKMVAKLREMPGWPVYKIKLGTPDDLAIVRELRRHTDATFRVDANCGWTAGQTIEFAPLLKKLGVEFIEQPLPPEDTEGARRAFENSALPLVADENCVTEADVDRCAGRFHGINIKLVKCGGLAAARRMIARARELGLQVMVGCMTESTVGISAIAQLLPLLDYVDMDGAVLLAKDIATGVHVERGRCVYPDVNGTGVTLIDGPLASNPVGMNRS
jgi:L-alanine-DL-glutamate epimerase-like enolase superfamily enzyme